MALPAGSNVCDGAGAACVFGQPSALFNPKTSILIQKRHPYTGNLNSEMPGDSKNAFLHCGHVSALGDLATPLSFSQRGPTRSRNLNSGMHGDQLQNNVDISGT